jgi:hypothetical protein
MWRVEAWRRRCSRWVAARQRARSPANGWTELRELDSGVPRQTRSCARKTELGDAATQVALADYFAPEILPLTNTYGRRQRVFAGVADAESGLVDEFGCNSGGRDRSAGDDAASARIRAVLGEQVYTSCGREHEGADMRREVEQGIRGGADGAGNVAGGERGECGGRCCGGARGEALKSQRQSAAAIFPDRAKGDRRLIRGRWLRGLTASIRAIRRIGRSIHGFADGVCRRWLWTNKPFDERFAVVQLRRRRTRAIRFGGVIGGGMTGATMGSYFGPGDR